jgi:hypothetical protein
MVAALARGSREPGQALTGAAISGVPLCEGRRHRVVEQHSVAGPLRFFVDPFWRRQQTF